MISVRIFFIRLDLCSSGPLVSPIWLPGGDRILKIPESKYCVLEYGDSTVNLDLLVWVDDPKNGILNVKDAVLMAVWDSFHANGITYRISAARSAYQRCGTAENN